MRLKKRFFPFWLSSYSTSKLSADLLAGLIVTLLVLPQSLAYAMLAGLPPQAGLYVSILPVFVYALLGSSMVQAVGPVAITAMMTAAALAPLATPGSSKYLALAASLSLFSGILLLLAGILRLGFLAQLLSRPVVAGFVSGSAVLIILSQLKHFLGVSSSTDALSTRLFALFNGTPDSHLTTPLLGLTTLLALASAQYFFVPWLSRHGCAAERLAFFVRLLPVLLVGGSTGLVIAWDLDHRHGVAVIGQVIEGLPEPVFFWPSREDWQTLLVPATMMALVGMVQNVTMAQALAIKRHERVRPNAELLGLGAANVAAAFHGGMPVGGGLSRSAVNVAAGAQSPMASIVSAMTMAGVAMAAAHHFSRVPLAALAASIVFAAHRMIDLRALRHAWSYDRADGIAFAGTAGGVLLLGPATGIGLGLILSMGTLLLRASSPHIAVIGRVPGTEHFRNIERHRVDTLPTVIFIRIDESLFFGNLGSVELRLKQVLSQSPDVRHLVLVMSAVNRMDATAVDVLEEINRDLAERKIRLHLAEVKGPVQDRLMKTALWSALSGEVFLSINAAFEKLATETGTRTVSQQ